MRTTVAASLLLGLLTTLATAAVPTLTAEQFDALRALIKPHPGEDKWAEIPWLTSLWEARRKAATEGKPLLLWEMDGHPLGCT